MDTNESDADKENNPKTRPLSNAKGCITEKASEILTKMIDIICEDHEEIISSFDPD